MRERAKSVWESAAAAETLTEELLDAALNRLQGWNIELQDLSKSLREAQGVATGSVALELQKCSPHGCRGCPHPRWFRYKWTLPDTDNPNGRLIATNLIANKINPAAALRRDKTRTESLAIIRKTQDVIKKRARFMSVLRSLGAAIHVQDRVNKC